jgi:sugar phosphate isomerase/epimerase
MKLGVCCNVLGETYPLAKECGFDYCEYAFRELFEMSDENFEKVLKNIDEIGLPVIRANGMFWNETKFFGEDKASKEEIKKMLDTAFPRARKMGIKVLVWGSGPTRKIPDDVLREDAEKELIEFGNMFADYAKEYGMTIVIEPLCKKETNVFNTVKNACEYSRKLNRPEIKVLADNFHMMAESETYEVFEKNMDLLVHTHIAEAEFGSDKVRLVPNEKDELTAKNFILELKKAGYDGTVSIEAGLRTGDWKKEMAEAARVIKSWMNQ